MAVVRRSSVVEAVRHLIDDSQMRDCPDEHLLHRFACERDEPAFEALLRRHGPMVHDVCSALLRNKADVEDAFQACFLLLAVKAKSIRKATSLAAWLHGVAWRIARKAQTEFARQRHHESRAILPEAIFPADDLSWREIRQVVHEEVNRLPERFRQVVVLCYLQGKRQDHAAVELGIPKGTLKGRLEHARELLRTRLTRRGLGPAGLVVAMAWPGAEAIARVPPGCVSSTLREAMRIAAGDGIVGAVSPGVDRLMKGSVNAMWLGKTIVVLTSVGLLVAMTFAFSAPGRETAGRKAEPEEPREKPVWQASLTTIPVQPGSVNQIAFAPNGKSLALAVTTFGIGGKVTSEVKLYDLATPKEPIVFPGFHSVTFSPDGKSLAFTDGSAVVHVWDRATRRERLTLKGLPDMVGRVVFSPDGRYLAAGSSSMVRQTNPALVRIWDLDDGVEKGTLLHPGSVFALGFSDDGKTLVSASSGNEMVVKTCEVPGARELATTKGPGGRFLAVALSPDGKRIATGIDPIGYNSVMDVKLWDLSTGKELIKPLRHEQLVDVMAFSPDGKILATGNYDNVEPGLRVAVLRLWDSATGKELAILRGDSDQLRCLDFGPHGKTLATGSIDGRVKLWTLAEARDEDQTRWVKSADGVLALRLVAKKKEMKPDEPIEVIVSVRNLSDKPVNILRPCGDNYRARSTGITLRGPIGALKYTGPNPTYFLGRNDFFTLGPGDTASDPLAITVDNRRNSDVPGDYRVTFTYEPTNADRDWAKLHYGLADLWVGRIRSEPIEVKKVDQDKQGAGNKEAQLRETILGRPVCVALCRTLGMGKIEELAGSSSVNVRQAMQVEEVLAGFKLQGMVLVDYHRELPEVTHHKDRRIICVLQPTFVGRFHAASLLADTAETRAIIKKLAPERARKDAAHVQQWVDTLSQKKIAGSFNFAVEYHGDEGRLPALGSLLIRDYPARDQRAVHYPAVMIDADQRKKLIDHLAADGYFLRALSDLGKNIPPPPKPSYTFRLTADQGNVSLLEVVNLDQSLLERLRSLQKVLGGDAGKEVFKIQAQFEKSLKEATPPDR